MFNFYVCVIFHLSYSVCELDLYNMMKNNLLSPYYLLFRY